MERLLLEKKLERLELFWKGKKEAVFKLMKEFWYDQALEEPEISLPYIPSTKREEFQSYLSKCNSKGRYKYIMFTINFREGITVDQAMKAFKKYTTKKWIINHYSCFEWRELDVGMHIHSVVQIADGKNPYECKREVYNTYKHLVGNKMHVNARYSNRDGCFKPYINGLKNERPKPTSEATTLMRDKHNIPSIFESSERAMLKEGEKREEHVV